VGTRKDAPKTVEYTFRSVLFQYRDRPNEWHLVCVENGASGWGPRPDDAVRELQVTINGQIEETFRSGKDFFFISPDEGWVRAFVEGVPPDEDIKLVARMIGHLAVKLHGKAQPLAPLRLEILSASKETQPV
jgi:hypothetical protein